MILDGYAPPEDSSELGLYAKSKDQQWNAAKDIDWSVPNTVDPIMAEISPGFAREVQAAEMSDFFYGEQASAAVCGKLLCEVPDIDARLFITTQVMDEGRHMEVFARFLDGLGGVRPCRAPFKELLEEFVAADTFEEKLVGMQIFAETLALTAFKSMARSTSSELLARVLQYVIRDESRHCAFGLQYLTRKVGGLTVAHREKIERTLARWWRMYEGATRAGNALVLRALSASQNERYTHHQKKVEAIVAESRLELEKRLDHLGLRLAA